LCLSKIKPPNPLHVEAVKSRRQIASATPENSRGFQPTDLMRQNPASRERRLKNRLVKTGNVSINQKSRIEIDAVKGHQLDVLILEALFRMMNSLVLNVPGNVRNERRTHRKGAVTILPARPVNLWECPANPAGRFSFDPFGDFRRREF
jgi:hypothetical protein